ncbi:O-fucosyltransferase 23-like [Gastrolobium bilobum]|uniref:O-fucosyltransferase 23-like n=1 Tax=Gastrolobium bilobum TaxID=150636 RepID=UPI002AB2F308|nr:O-fucosyltransferase 23-like [Gastrolobium bilobum]XP_061356016.1 O-fucosyltransferase 23-like [Gastrolobium bilobum]
MEMLFNCKLSKFMGGGTLNSIACKCVFLLVAVLVLRALLLPSSPVFGGVEWSNIVYIRNKSPSFGFGVRQDKFLEVPQIVWGLNNQKIAFARACLTARMLNRTLLMPSLSASLFYKEIDLLQPISFDKVFQFDKFNALCSGFVQLGRYSDLLNRTQVLEMQKGSGRKWTVERDLDQLRQHSSVSFDDHEVIRIVGKNPFLWHDHWPVKDYAKVFECLLLIDEIAQEADRVVSRIRAVGSEVLGNTESMEVQHENDRSSFQPLPYVAVHMRIEIDWMIHCKKLEQRLSTNQICSSKKEIMERVGSIIGLKTPVVVYLAVADKLLKNSSVLEGWEEGFLPFEKKKLGVDGIYSKYPYLIQSAIDYEVCLRADIFVGNSFSTFSSLIVLERTQKMIRMGVNNMCGTDVRWPSYAYNIPGESNGPMRWVTNMSDSSLQAISYGTNHISC